MAEARTSSYNHVVQTPKIGGCTGAFLNLFDWNNKRFPSTKRLPAERLERGLGRSRSFCDDRNAGVSRGCPPSTKTLSLEKDRRHVLEDEATLKPPGLVARLMGLESLPEVPTPSRHRRSRSEYSGSESALRSSRDNRGERLALQDLLKHDHEPFQNFGSGELAIVPVEYHNQQEKRVRKAVLQTRIKTLVPCEDSPAESCRSIYALPYVHKGEKSPFLARLHPSPVLQPSKFHNQMVSSAKTSPATKKRTSYFLEAAVKILEEISDNEQCLPREREGMRSVAELAASSPPSSATDLLHCRSMSKVWNGSEDMESVGSRSNRSLMSRGSISSRDLLRDSQRRDRVCRDIFETLLSDRTESVTPPPRRSRTKGGATNEVKRRGILRTQEATVGDFKTNVRKTMPDAQKVRSETNSMSNVTDNVRYLQQTAALARRRSLHSQARAISNGLEDDDFFTSDEESLTDQLVRLASSGADVTTESNILQVSRSSFRKSPREGAMSSPVFNDRMNGNSKEQISVRDGETIVSSPRLRTRSTSGGLHDGLRPIKVSRNQGDQQENALTVSSNRALSAEFRKSRSASSHSHSQQFSRQLDESKLPIRIKREKYVRAAATESPTAPSVHSNSSPLPSASPLKRSRRKSRHGSPKLRESSGHLRGGERTPPLPNLHSDRRKHQNVEAKRNSTRGNDAKKSPVKEVLDMVNVDDVFYDTALAHSRNDAHEIEMVEMNPDTKDEYLSDLGNSVLYGHEEVEQAQDSVRDLFPSSEVGECSNPDEPLILGMDDLHWDDVMPEQHRENSSRARYCEIRASGESLPSFCGAALDEDVCNVDDGSSPSPQKFARECSEADVPDEYSTPVLMKRFLGKPLRLEVDMGETSPVSVLESPFGDEVCTISESSIVESDRQQANNAPEQASEAVNLTKIVTESEHEIELEVVSTPRGGLTPIDRVRQAILDISSFRSLDHKRASDAALRSPPTEKTFVREVLSAAQLLSSPGRSPNWYERDLAVDPSLFEKLEGGYATSADDGDFFCESGGMWRCDRKLLFDSVNEAFSQNARSFKDPQPWLRRPVLRRRSVRQKLVEEVQEKIKGWRELASQAIDTLIDIDMSTRLGKWTDFSEQVADVGAEIECMVWQVMVEEFVLELAGSLH